MSGLLRRARLPIYVAMAATLGAGCELFIGLDSLDSQQCQSNQKQCPGANPHCVSNNSVETSCGDPNSCAPCTLLNAVPTCTAGMCAIGRCIDPYRDCENKGDCQTDTNHSELHCGGCNQPCSTMNGFPGCLDGICVIGGCYPGFAHCDGTNNLACETSIWTDMKCGDSCDAGPCPSGTTCQQGTCR